jgi:DNA polymerase-1
VDAIEVMEKPSVGHIPLTLIDRQDALQSVAPAIEETHLVGLDIETTGLNPRADTARLLSLACDTVDCGTHVYVIDLAAIDPTPLWPVLADRQIVAHNAAFDLAFLTRLGFAPGKIIDTMVESQLTYCGERTAKHGLADCAMRELGITIDKAFQTSDWSGTLTPAQIEYAALDADLARRLHEKLSTKIKSANVNEVTGIEHRALLAIVWLAQSGVGFDRDAWLALAGESETERDRMRNELDAAAPSRPQGEMFGPS